MVSWTLFLHVLDDQFNAMIVVWHNLPFFPWECRWLEISHEQDIFSRETTAVLGGVYAIGWFVFTAQVVLDFLEVMLEAAEAAATPQLEEEELGREKW